MEELLQNVIKRCAGRVVRAAREAAGLSQQSLGDRLHEPQSYVHKIEKGERELHLSEWPALCRALDISLEAFVKAFRKAMREAPAWERANRRAA